MIGVFDSGRGGLAAFREIRRAMPHADIAYLADRKNAPYGTKSRNELVRLVSEDIKRLSEIGAEKILIACCTASSVYDALPEQYRRISLPIIEPTAMAALGATRGSITVFATEATVRSSAFSRAIARLCPICSVCELAAQRLVRLIEYGAPRDAVFAEVSELVSKMPDSTDTVVLGCTHFSFAREEFSRLLGDGVQIIDSASVGARCIIEKESDVGFGRCLYT